MLHKNKYLEKLTLAACVYKEILEILKAVEPHQQCVIFPFFVHPGRAHLHIYYESHQYRNKSKSQLTSPTPAQLPAVAVSTGHIVYINLSFGLCTVFAVSISY
jgi:hypothetical protein